MSEHKKANLEWDATNAKGGVDTWEQVNSILLMDIRAELRRLNALLHCSNFIGIPSQLAQLRKLEPIAKMARRANTNAAKRKAVNRV